MNRDEWRVYNRDKQRIYRRKKNPAVQPIELLAYTRIERVFHKAGHCPFCQMLLDSEYHKLHPLQGCLKAIHAEKRIEPEEC
jgi:hypothetical protein